MDQNDREQRSSDVPKEFLALSHGREWVSFYESFDKLVQDNLARSSELLRRAMSLPEVADREVQQIRSEMEAKLAAERDRQRALLGVLKDDISGSHRQVSMLARSVGAVMTDLERLGQRVNEALAAFDRTPAASADQNGHADIVANGVVAAEANADSEATAVAPAESTSAEPASAESTADSDEAAEFELPAADEFAAPFDVSDIAAAVQEQQALLDAAEQQLDHLEDAIDLNALAEAETDQPAAEEPAAAAAPPPAAAESRPRPHWLSVTRVGSSS